MLQENFQKVSATGEEEKERRRGACCWEDDDDNEVTFDERINWVDSEFEVTGRYLLSLKINSDEDVTKFSAATMREE